MRTKVRFRHVVWWYPMTTPSTEPSTEPFFIGIDYHKRYSVYCVVDVAGQIQVRGRIDHATPSQFGALVKQWPGRVVFEAVTFRYRPDGPEILRTVSFQVMPGKVIGIVGRSGSGKSTIAKLIQRLYVPERGRVLIDGIDLAQIDPAWLHGTRRIGVTAGASAPQVLVDAVIAQLKTYGAQSVRVLEGVEEHVTFPLPKGLSGTPAAG